MTVFEARVIQTDGDKIQDQPVTLLGDKGIFVRAIEHALLAGEIDGAIHSLKDMPGDAYQPDLEISCFSRREDPRDVIVSRHGTIQALPRFAKVGTGSLRRAAQLSLVRSDLHIADIRGNVDTRLRKLDAGEYDAVILAAAGLHRLGLEDRITEYLDPREFVPDAGQGIIAVQTRPGSAAASVTRTIDDPEARSCAIAERAVVSALQADCRSPVGAFAHILHGRIELVAVAARDAGSPLCRARADGNREDSYALGWKVGMQLLASILSHE
jgi:hydroxymethylbilane synthase